MRAHNTHMHTRLPTLTCDTMHRVLITREDFSQELMVKQRPEGSRFMKGRSGENLALLLES